MTHESREILLKTLTQYGREYLLGDLVGQRTEDRMLIWVCGLMRPASSQGLQLGRPGSREVAPSLESVDEMACVIAGDRGDNVAVHQVYGNLARSGSDD
jgi:hypothetical protein